MFAATRVIYAGEQVLLSAAPQWFAGASEAVDLQSSFRYLNINCHNLVIEGGMVAGGAGQFRNCRGQSIAFTTRALILLCVP